MLIDLMLRWLIAFCVTYLLEICVYLRLTRSGPAWLSRRKVTAHCLIANLSTHPFIFLILPQYFANDYFEYVITAECIAILGEGCMLRFLRFAKPLKLAIIANLLSWGLGTPLDAFLSDQIFGLPD